MKILITAFEPFGGEARNASAEILEALPGRIGPAEIRKLIVPTAFERCSSPAEREILSFSPDAVICLGQAGGASPTTTRLLPSTGPSIRTGRRRISPRSRSAPWSRPFRLPPSRRVSPTRRAPSCATALCTPSSASPRSACPPFCADLYMCLISPVRRRRACPLSRLRTRYAA